MKWYLLFLTVMLFACSHPKIQVGPEFPRDVLNIKSGETAQIKLDFINADSVSVNDTTTYKSGATLNANPTEFTFYRIKAFNKYGEELIQHLSINVSAPEGPSPGSESSSDTFSDYLAGIINIDAVKNPIKIKITKNRIVDGNTQAMDFLPMDEFGNYILNLDKKRDETDITLMNIFPSASLPYKVDEIKQVTGDNSEVLNLAFLIENSAISNNEGIGRILAEFIEQMNSQDKIMVSCYNHNVKPIIDLSIKPDALNQKEKIVSLPPNSGLNSINKAVYHTIKALEGKGKACIIVLTYSYDLSSVIYDESQNIELSKKFNIPIYIVGIGNHTWGYPLRYLTSATGARFYNLHNEEVANLGNLLREIYFSQKNYYTLELPINEEKIYNIYKSVLIINDKNTESRDSIYVVNNKHEIYKPHQYLLTFDKNNSEIDNSYDNSISDLAESLKNVSYKILLESNSWDEDDTGNRLSEQRLKNIKYRLMKYGVPERNILTRSNSFSKPVYPFPAEEWQNQYNRRIEIRWMDPAQKPYEILAEKANSEEEASKYVEVWEKRSQKAYYERLYLPENIAYRVKIWGFGTLEEAEKQIKIIEKKFNKKFEIE